MILRQFQDALQKEYRASCGSPPTVAILGHEDYETLIGELKIMFSRQLTPQPFDLGTMQRLEYLGVVVARSYSMKTGIYFGS